MKNPFEMSGDGLESSSDMLQKGLMEDCLLGLGDEPSKEAKPL